MEKLLNYFKKSGTAADCSTARSARLRERRFQMGYEEREEPEAYRLLAESTRDIYLDLESDSPAIARATALHHAVSNCPITIENDALLVLSFSMRALNLSTLNVPVATVMRLSTSARHRARSYDPAPAFEQ